MGGLVGLLFIFAVALFAEQIAPYGYDELDFNNLRIAPTMRDHHYFGTDRPRLLQPGRLRDPTSVCVALVVTSVTTVIGTTAATAATSAGGSTTR